MATSESSGATAWVRAGTPAGRAVVAAATLGSAMSLLDGTVVNVALRTIGADLDASITDLQWVTNGYLLALAGLILLGGSLGDRLGRRRVFVHGTVGFGLASALCGLAPTAEVLIAARVLQGVAAALMVPGSLSMIQGAFDPRDRARAIGTWTGLGAIAGAAGPLVGGFLVEYADWRLVFWINVPLAVLTVWLARSVPETRDPGAAQHLDVPGAVLATLALTGVTYALVQWGDPAALPALAVGLVTGAGFLVVEARVDHPMLALGVFADRTFSAANAMTLLVYGALSVLLFMLPLQLQVVGGDGPLVAGLATLPLPLVMLLLAGRGGALGARIGPRLPLTLGPLVMAAGALLLLGAGEAAYVVAVLPGMVVFALGLALLVATLTATVLAAAPDDHAGIASGVNNAVSRAGGLLAVAAVPSLVGLGGDEYADPAALDPAWTLVVLACAGLLVLGGVLSWFTIPRTALDPNR
ncbi:Multidrug resistance protein stp [Nocardioides dokdonensis FR1436]|uniref:Multidrug resistance protein stp n=1 Tax=Nocardioides dokdonensis FR1436 TaxID=1300347 RepID=A0A1A9GJC5_9ACTN|nr:MFS transporter [Nocardioides dokdonensis]ANH37780.1 Multidrug resistance protein stp [Nocardioides dokdonensis FR1436]